MKKSKTPTQGLGTTPAVPLLVLAVFLSAKPTQENPLTAAEIAEKIQEKIPNFAVKGKLIVEAVKRLQLFLDLTKFDLEIESSTHGQKKMASLLSKKTPALTPVMQRLLPKG